MTFTKWGYACKQLTLSPFIIPSLFGHLHQGWGWGWGWRCIWIRCKRFTRSRMEKGVEILYQYCDWVGKAHLYCHSWQCRQWSQRICISGRGTATKKSTKLVCRKQSTHNVAIWPKMALASAAAWRAGALLKEFGTTWVTMYAGSWMATTQLKPHPAASMRSQPGINNNRAGQSWNRFDSLVMSQTRQFDRWTMSEVSSLNIKHASHEVVEL